MGAWRVLSGIGVAFLVALALKGLLGAPIALTFGVLALLVVVQIVQARFGSELDQAKRWGRLALSVVIGFGIFLGLRILAGAFVGVPLRDSYEAWGSIGGLSGLLQAKTVPLMLRFELLFLLVAGALSVLFARGHAAARRLVWAVFVGMFAVTAIQLVAPRRLEWSSSSWPEPRTTGVPSSRSPIPAVKAPAVEQRAGPPRPAVREAVPPAEQPRGAKWEPLQERASQPRGAERQSIPADSERTPAGAIRQSSPDSR